MKTVLYAGWYEWSSGVWDYFDDATDMPFAHSFSLVWFEHQDRMVGKVNMLYIEERNRTIPVPDSVRTLEEAKAWAMATWRML